MIDPVTLTIVNNSFVNICREMGITMMRTAFSPIFNEGLDFSCVLFDREAQLIGQGEFCPAHPPETKSSRGIIGDSPTTASLPAWLGFPKNVDDTPGKRLHNAVVPSKRAWREAVKRNAHRIEDIS